MHLVGLDIGFSETRRSNAIADLADGELRVRKVNIAERNDELRNLRDVDVIAIDAPIVSTSCKAEMPRPVEQTFSRGPFQKRCKPGMSHVPGTGRLLRQHGMQAAHIVAEAARWHVPPPFPTIVPGYGIVEAFPNAFLGVALDDGAFVSASDIPRGGKFDWLYDRWVERGLFAGAVAECGLPLSLVDHINHERDHDKRAALVCLLTAATALTGNAVSIGDETTGYFFLPSVTLWRTWATQAVERNRSNRTGSTRTNGS